MIEQVRHISLGRELQNVGTLAKKALSWIVTHLVDGKGTMDATNATATAARIKNEYLYSCLVATYFLLQGKTSSATVAP